MDFFLSNVMMLNLLESTSCLSFDALLVEFCSKYLRGDGLCLSLFTLKCAVVAWRRCCGRVGTTSSWKENRTWIVITCQLCEVEGWMVPVQVDGSWNSKKVLCSSPVFAWQVRRGVTLRDGYLEVLNDGWEEAEQLLPAEAFSNAASFTFAKSSSKKVSD
jgi:hypothetical protein